MKIKLLQHYNKMLLLGWVQRNHSLSLSRHQRILTHSSLGLSSSLLHVDSIHTDTVLHHRVELLQPDKIPSGSLELYSNCNSKKSSKLQLIGILTDS